MIKSNYYGFNILFETCQYAITVLNMNMLLTHTIEVLTRHIYSPISHALSEGKKTIVFIYILLEPNGYLYDLSVCHKVHIRYSGHGIHFRQDQSRSPVNTSPFTSFCPHDGEPV
jgi:hypothetical protein